MASLASGTPASQQEVGQKLGVDRITMVALIDSLERKGMLARRADPLDRRRNVVELTAAGIDTLLHADDAAGEAERVLLTPLGPRREQQLREALQLLVQVSA